MKLNQPKEDNHFKEVIITPIDKRKHHHVTKDEACDYIFRFVTEFYPKGVRTNGGYLSKQALLNMGFCTEPTKKGTSFDGLLMWFCLKKDDHKNAFLAFERDQNYDVTEPYKSFNSGHDRMLAISTEETILSHQYTRCEVEDVIINGNYSLPSVEKNIKSSEVKALVEEFCNYFPATAQGSKYNMYPIGFWVKEEVEDLLKQEDIIGVRYYFGYNPDVVNKIRIVFVGVKNDWNNMVMVGDGIDAVFLQNTWPPPPYNLEGDSWPIDID